MHASVVDHVPAAPIGDSPRSQSRGPRLIDALFLPSLVCIIRGIILMSADVKSHGERLQAGAALPRHCSVTRGGEHQIQGEQSGRGPLLREEEPCLF